MKRERRRKACPRQCGLHFSSGGYCIRPHRTSILRRRFATWIVNGWHASPRLKIPDDIAKQIMADDPTPEDRKVLTVELSPKTTGELFLYVNDAVLMLPGVRSLFFDNNRGGGTLTVERINAQGAAGAVSH